MKTKPVIAAVAVVLGLLVASGGARAQSDRCSTLVSELRSLGGAGGASETARRKVAALEKRSAAFGCSNTRVTGRPRECAGISAQLNTARRQLSSAGGGGDAARRKRVQAELARLRCGQAPAAPAQRSARLAPSRDTAAPKAPRYVNQGGRVVELGASNSSILAGGTGGIFSLLFGGGASEAAPTRGRPAQTATLARLQSDPKTPRAPARAATDEDGTRTYARGSFGGGSYRTLCVRSCDGYYFPISAVTSRGNFQRDETVCRALCPSTEVALYAHPVGSESERMHAITDGMPYEALPAAFQYRKSVDTACSCAFEAKLVVTADGRTAIDVEAIAAAYSPATTIDAAEAIAAATAAAAVADGSLAVPEGAVVPGAASDGVSQQGMSQEGAGASLASPGDALPPGSAPAEAQQQAVTVRLPHHDAPPAPATPVDTAALAGAPAIPTAASPAETAIPTIAVLPSGELVQPAVSSRGTSAGTEEAVAEPASIAANASAAASEVSAGPAGPQQDVAATAPGATPVPATTRRTLRVRTIGPAFLQNQ